MRSPTLSIATLLLAATNIVIAFPFSWASLPDTQARSVTDDLNVLVPNRLGIYFCKNANWEKPCEKLNNGPGICINLSDVMAGEVSSVGPDDGVSGCTLFEAKNCNSTSGTFLQGLKKPGEGDLSQAPQAGKFNDMFRSYICY